MTRISKYWLLAILALTCLEARNVRAQESRFDGVVTRIQGRGVYVNAGSEQGLAADDTVSVMKSEDLKAWMRVIGASTGSALLTWVGPSIDVQVGDTLHFLLPRPFRIDKLVENSPGQAERGSLLGGPLPQVRERSRSPGPRFRATVMLNFIGMRSQARPGPGLPASPAQTFATPTFTFRGTVSNLPGKTMLTMHVRASHRYNSLGFMDRPNSLRIYQVSVSKMASSSGLGLQLGRFNNRNEPESGYWDGLQMQFRMRRLEYGVAIGLEPDRFDEGFRSDLPKYSAHVILKPFLGTFLWNTAVSFTQMRPSNDWLTHSYFGLDQRMKLGGLSVSTEVQLDNNPEMPHWMVSQFRSRGELKVLSALSLQVRHAMRRPYTYWRTDQVISYRRDQTTLGMTFFSKSGGLGLYVTRNAYAAADESYTYSANLSGVVVPIIRATLSSSASYWTQVASQTTYASFALSKQIAASRVQFLYSIYRADVSQDRLRSQTLGAAVQIPLWSRAQVSMQARTLLSEELVSTTLSINLWMSI